MNKYELDLATREDDLALRQLLAATPLQGDISLTFAREPSYFAAARIDGEFVQVLVAREIGSNRIVGMGSRAISSCFVQGETQPVGYLSSLRVQREYRGHAGLLARGYRAFRDIHADQRAPYYLTTITADNYRAIELLTSQRAGLPIYFPLGRFHTLTISSAIQVKAVIPNNIKVRVATSESIQTISRFFREHGPRRQFFPDYSVSEEGLIHRLSGLRSSDLLLAFDGNELVGTLGIWDQRPFKQIIVADYSNRTKYLRPIYNGLAQLSGRPALPRIGKAIDLRYGAVIVVKNDNQAIVDALLATALKSLLATRSKILVVGLHESDPLLPAVRRYSGREYTTYVYLVHWPDQTPDYQQLLSRVPYLETGCL
jgi:hypothetical protein